MELIFRFFNVKLRFFRLPIKTIGNFGLFYLKIPELLRKETISISALFLLLTLIYFHCANPVSPQGGPRDNKPPEVIACTPENLTVNFVSKEIRISFDEFVELKSSGTDIVISPPLQENADYKIRKKSLIVELPDTLLPNTTYIISFDKAIADITEGNELSGFRYIFSTGGFIDSLMISGQVTNAFDNEPSPDVFALLYTDSNDTIPFDSLPYKVKPLYISRTDDRGSFMFTTSIYKI